MKIQLTTCPKCKSIIEVPESSNNSQRIKEIQDILLSTYNDMHNNKHLVGIMLLTELIKEDNN